MRTIRTRLSLRLAAVMPGVAITIALSTGASSMHAGVSSEALIAGAAAPRAVTPLLAFNFGDVYTGDVISQIFVIRNDGDADLLITDVTSGCGCSVARADKVIAPGKEGRATLEVQTISQSGEIAKTASLHTNDPGRPVIVFTLAANVLKGAPARQGKYIGPIFLSPGSSGALFAFPGKKVKTEFLVTADRTSVNVLRVEGGTQHFTTRVETIEPGKRYKIIVESLPIEVSEMYQDQLQVITDSPSLPAFQIDLSLRVYDTK